MDVFDDSTSLERLVAAASMGNEAARFELFRRFNKLVCRSTLRCLRLKGCNAIGDHSEDIINSSWLTILEHLHQLKQSEKIVGWMRRIILHTVCAHVSGPRGCISDQQNRVQLEAAEEARIEHADRACENALLADEIRARAYARSPKFNEVMRLHVEGDYTMEEIARERGESPSKLRSMYYRYLRDLKKFFRDDGNDDDDSSES